MARPRKIVTTEFEDEAPSGTPWTPADVGPLPPDDDVQQIVGAIGGTAVEVKVSKVSNPNAGYCYTVDEGQQIDYEFIRETWGGGRFVAKIFKSGVFQTQVPFAIAEKLNAQAGNVGGVAAGGELQIRLMQQQIDFLKDLALQRSNQPQSSIGELADAIQKLGLMNGGGSEKSIELLMKGFEVGQKIAGGSGGSSDWMDLLKEALPMVRDVVASRANIPAPAQPVAMIPEETTMVNPLQPENVSDLIRAGIAYLKRKAAQGVDADLFIDLLIANRDDPQYSHVIEYVLANDFVVITALDPDIDKPGPLRSWFRSFYDGLRSEFGPTDPVAVDTGGTGGNVGDAASHGAPRKARKPSPKPRKATA